MNDLNKNKKIKNSFEILNQIIINSKQNQKYEVFINHFSFMMSIIVIKILSYTLIGSLNLHLNPAFKMLLYHSY